MNELYVFSIELKLQGPVSTHGSNPSTFGLDAPMEIDKEGRYCLPGRHVKGKLKEAWFDLRDAGITGFDDALVGSMLGKEVGRGSWEPERGQLIVSELSSDKKDSKDVLYRIEIDDERGAVKRGAFQVIESPWKPGEAAVFKGSWHAHLKSEQDANDLASKIRVGLLWTCAYGAEKTVGFGQPLSCAVSVSTESSQQVSAGQAHTVTPADTKRLCILKPRTPFCITKRRIADNVFESESTISGTVIRGCLATMLCAREGKALKTRIDGTSMPSFPTLATHFSSIRIHHALPTKTGSDQSLSRTVHPSADAIEIERKVEETENGEQRVRKCVYEECAYGYTYDPEEDVPRFSPDWKYRDSHFAITGWQSPSTRMTVRTAIDHERKSAEKGKLFSYEEIMPKDEIRWVSVFDLSQIPEADRPSIWKELDTLLGTGLMFIGKTRATADATWAHFAGQTFDIEGKKSVALVLQSPAVILDPGTASTVRTEADLKRVYESYFDKAFGEEVELVDYFIRQNMAGGIYYQGRLMPAVKPDPAGNVPYMPYIIEEPGNTYILRPKTGKMWANLTSQNCLPLPGWARELMDFYKDKLFPFDIVNGFGEYRLEERPRPARLVSKD